MFHIFVLSLLVPVLAHRPRSISNNKHLLTYFLTYLLTRGSVLEVISSGWCLAVE